MDEQYNIPEHPVYDSNIRKIQDEDPVQASSIVNPVLERIIENAEAVKQQVDVLEEKTEAGANSDGSTTVYEERGGKVTIPHITDITQMKDKAHTVFLTSPPDETGAYEQASTVSLYDALGSNLNSALYVRTIFLIGDWILTSHVNISTYYKAFYLDDDGTYQEVELDRFFDDTSFNYAYGNVTVSADGRCVVFAYSEAAPPEKTFPFIYLWDDSSGVYRRQMVDDPIASAYGYGMINISEDYKTIGMVQQASSSSSNNTPLLYIYDEELGLYVKHTFASMANGTFPPAYQGVAKYNMSRDSKIVLIGFNVSSLNTYVYTYNEQTGKYVNRFRFSEAGIKINNYGTSSYSFAPKTEEGYTVLLTYTDTSGTSVSNTLFRLNYDGDTYTGYTINELFSERFGSNPCTAAISQNGKYFMLKDNASYTSLVEEKIKVYTLDGEDRFEEVFETELSPDYTIVDVIFRGGQLKFLKTLLREYEGQFYRAYDESTTIDTYNYVSGERQPYKLQVNGLEAKEVEGGVKERIPVHLVYDDKADCFKSSNYCDGGTGDTSHYALKNDLEDVSKRTGYAFNRANMAYDIAANVELSKLNPVAIGEGAVVNGNTYNSTALGVNAGTNSYYNSTALGSNTWAGGNNSVAIGAQARTYWGNGTAVGKSSFAQGNRAVAIGVNAYTSMYGNCTVVVGASSRAESAYAVAIGYYANGGSLNSVSIGPYSRVYGTDGVALGNYAIGGIKGIGIGVTANAGENSVAIGANAIAGSPTMATGNGLVTYSDCIALGQNSNAMANGAVAIGTEASVHADDSIVLGSAAHAAGYERSVALGYHAQAIENDSIHLGSPDPTEYSALYSLRDISVLSDERDKADIEDIENALSFLNSIKPVRYVDNARCTYTLEEFTEEQKVLKEKYAMHKSLYDVEGHEKGTKKGRQKRVGLLAQDVQETMEAIYGTDNYAELVHDNLCNRRAEGEEFPEEVEEMLSINYSSFIPFMIKALQEVTERLERLEAKNE